MKPMGMSYFPPFSVQYPEEGYLIIHEAWCPQYNQDHDHNSSKTN